LGKGRFVNQKLAKRTGHAQQLQKSKLETRPVFQREHGRESKSDAIAGKRKSGRAIMDFSWKDNRSLRNELNKAIEGK
jgi:hypothetical protein